MQHGELFSEGARWMKTSGGSAAPFVKKCFYVESGGPATIRICGLGFFELFCNGERVGPDLFKPVWSDYAERKLDVLLYPTEDHFSHTIYVYETSLELKSGENELCILLGNGWFRQTEKNVEGKLSYGRDLQLCFDIDCNCRHVVSDETLTYTDSFITFDNVYYGEVHDYAARSSSERRMLTIDPPEAEFLLQDCPCDRVIREIFPVMKRRNGKKCVYDVGENISGWVKVKSSGGEVTVRYAEELDAAGNLDFTSSGGREQIFVHTYKNTGNGQSLFPYFSYTGFRYFEVEGDVEEVSAEVVHSNVAVTSFFYSDNRTLNRLYDAYVRTQLCNMHSGVPTDCPHRERLGYTGDGQLVSETALLLLDSAAFFRKWIRDIFDCQDPQSGHVQHTAPFYGGGGGPGGWGGAIAIVPWNYYRSTGDESVLQEAYPRILKYLHCMKSRFSQAGLIVREYDGGWCLGDWCAPGGTIIPEAFVNTYFYILCMRIADQIADILGKSSTFSQDVAVSLDALKAEFYDPALGLWCNGVQGADAFAADLGLEVDIDGLERRYRESRVFDTGIFGTEVLCRVLWRHGRHDTLFRLLTSEKAPSFGALFGQGATTLWENWDGSESHSHPMFGACVKYLFKSFLGIDLLQPGGTRVRISPAEISGLNQISGGVQTMLGCITVALEKSEDEIRIRTMIPRGTEADLVFREKIVKLPEGLHEEIFCT